MRGRSFSLLADSGRVAAGVVLSGMATIKIIKALLLGRIPVFTFAASFSEQPALFVAMLAIWAVVLASGLSYLARGVTGLWRRRRDTSTASSQ
jgi:hypothetical protein